MATYNDGNHSGGSFATDEPGTAEQNDDGHWNRGHCESELCSSSSRDQHKELNCEAQKEEEIEFQQRDVDLDPDRLITESEEGIIGYKPGKSDSGASSADQR